MVLEHIHPFLLIMAVYLLMIVNRQIRIKIQSLFIPMTNHCIHDSGGTLTRAAPGTTWTSSSTPPTRSRSGSSMGQPVGTPYTSQKLP